MSSHTDPGLGPRRTERGACPRQPSQTPVQDVASTFCKAGTRVAGSAHEAACRRRRRNTSVDGALLTKDGAPIARQCPGQACVGEAGAMPDCGRDRARPRAECPRGRAQDATRHVAPFTRNVRKWRICRDECGAGTFCGGDPRASRRGLSPRSAPSAPGPAVTVRQEGTPCWRVPCSQSEHPAARFLLSCLPGVLRGRTALR